jgi:sterol desaturase/sphingolipid hydroxylase (fatty acid hydroxylase superfamily)
MHGAIRVFKKSHLGHHKHPSNMERIFIPCIFTLINACLNALAYFVLHSPNAALSSVTGNVMCYAAFEWAHIVCHNGNKSRLTRGIRTHHLAHHFFAQRVCNFGFTSATWDLVFGTYYSKDPVGIVKTLVLMCPLPLLPFLAF